MSKIFGKWGFSSCVLKGQPSQRTSFRASYAVAMFGRMFVGNSVVTVGGQGRRMSTRVRKPMEKGFVSPMLTVPKSIPYPEYANSGRPVTNSPGITCYDKSDVPRLRKAAQLARNVLEFGLKNAVPGVTTDHIDKLCHAEMIKSGAYPSPLNYFGFPKSICTSVNEVVCHGIPDNRVLEDGDIISIDVSLFLDGVHGDNCGTVVVGQPNAKLQHLIDANKMAVKKAIEKCKPGSCVSEIGKTIEEFARSQNYSVVHEFCGHGTGRYLHMNPLIMHYNNSHRTTMRPGMVFTIEPILVAGKRDIFTWPDEWTAASSDGSWSSQIEHEVLITETGVEVLTALDGETF